MDGIRGMPSLNHVAYDYGTSSSRLLAYHASAIAIGDARALGQLIKPARQKRKKGDMVMCSSDPGLYAKSDPECGGSEE